MKETWKEAKKSVLANVGQARSPDTPVILLTGTDKENVLKRVGKGLVDSVIFKPFILEHLEKTVQGSVDVQ